MSFKRFPLVALALHFLLLTSDVLSQNWWINADKVSLTSRRLLADGNDPTNDHRKCYVKFELYKRRINMLEHELEETKRKMQEIQKQNIMLRNLFRDTGQCTREIRGSLEALERQSRAVYQDLGYHATFSNTSLRTPTQFQQQQQQQVSAVPSTHYHTNTYRTILPDSRFSNHNIQQGTSFLPAVNIASSPYATTLNTGMSFNNHQSSYSQAANDRPTPVEPLYVSTIGTFLQNPPNNILSGHGNIFQDSNNNMRKEERH